MYVLIVAFPDLRLVRALSLLVQSVCQIRILLRLHFECTLTNRHIILYKQGSYAKFVIMQKRIHESVYGAIYNLTLGKKPVLRAG